MTRHQRFIDKALSLAATSRHHKFKHAAVVARNNRQLASGLNKPRTPARIDFHHASVHAEISALKHVSLGKRITLYVARINRYGQQMLSRPCPACWDKLVELGVDEVVYTLAGDGYAVESIGGGA